MNERTAIIESGDFSFQLDQVQKWIEESRHPVAVEGLRGSSRAFFLSKLINLKNRSVIIFTVDQTQGEILQDDLKYFFHYEYFHHLCNIDYIQTPPTPTPPRHRQSEALRMWQSLVAGTTRNFACCWRNLCRNDMGLD